MQPDPNRPDYREPTDDRTRDARPSATESRVRVGDHVEVRNHFDGTWSRGFEVTDILPAMGAHRYRIRRVSDGAVLPRLFAEEVVRSG
jgi:hypothetical protein